MGGIGHGVSTAGLYGVIDAGLSWCHWTRCWTGSGGWGGLGWAGLESVLLV